MLVAMRYTFCSACYGPATDLQRNVLELCSTGGLGEAVASCTYSDAPTQCCLCTSTASHITNLQQVVGGAIWNPIYQEDTPSGEHPGAPSPGEDLGTPPRLAPTRMRISMLLGIAHAAYLLPCRSRCPWGSVSELHPLGKDSGTPFLDALRL
jgi:hypothetical protein